LNVLRPRFWYLRGAASPLATGSWGKAAELASQALLVTLVPRMLGPSGYGVFALGLAVVRIGSGVLGASGSAVMGRFVPAASEEERLAVARALSVRLGVFAAAQVAVAAFVAVVLVAWSGTRPSLAALVVVALAVELGATAVSQVALGLGRIAAWSVRFPLENLILVAAAIALHSWAGTNGAVAALAVAGAAGLGFGAIAVADVRAAGRMEGLPRGAIRFGALSALATALLLVCQRGGVLVVGLLGTADEAGRAALAIGVSLTITYTVGWIFLAQLPSLSGRWAMSPEEVEATCRRLSRVMFALVVPVAAVAAVAARPLLVALVGSKFRGAESAVAPALAACVLTPLTSCTWQIAALRLRPEVRAWSAAWGVLAFAATAFTAIPAWGAAGGAAALLAGTAATLVVSAVRLPGAVPRSSVLVALGVAAGVVALGSV
jgi:O-antigen/teichoic acid export membrane protein